MKAAPMTPLEQSHLPWLVTAKPSEIEAAAFARDVVEGQYDIIKSGNISDARFSAEIIEDSHDRNLRFIHNDEHGNTTFIQVMFSIDLHQQALAGWESHEQLARQTSQITLMRTLMYKALSAPIIAAPAMPGKDDHLLMAVNTLWDQTPHLDAGHLVKAEINQATPLGTGGLHILDDEATYGTDRSPRWCKPGAINVSALRTIKDDRSRTVVTIQAETCSYLVNLPTALERLRLEARYRSSR